MDPWTRTALFFGCVIVLWSVDMGPWWCLCDRVWGDHRATWFFFSSSESDEAHTSESFSSLTSPLQMRSPKSTRSFTCVCVRASPAGTRTTAKASSVSPLWASTMASTSTRRAAFRFTSRGRWRVRPLRRLAKRWNAARGTGVTETSLPSCPLKVPMVFSISRSRGFISVAPHSCGLRICVARSFPLTPWTRAGGPWQVRLGEEEKGFWNLKGEWEFWGNGVMRHSSRKGLEAGFAEQRSPRTGVWLPLAPSVKGW